MSTYADIKQAVDALRIIDTHEHLCNEEDRLAGSPDPLGMLCSNYLCTDAISAGLPVETMNTVRDPRRPLEERWGLLSPVWPFIQSTGYGRAAQIIVRELYGVEELSAATLPVLAERMAAAQRPGMYREILCEKSKIDAALRTTEKDDRPPTPPLLNVGFFDWILHINTLEGLEALGKYTGIPIHGFDDLLAATTRVIDGYQEMGYVALKLGIAYFRSLHFPRVTAHEAEAALNRIFDTPKRPLYYPHTRSMEELAPLQNYLLHVILGCAAKHGFPVQVHTGYQEGYGNTIANSDPVLLTNLLIQYPDVHFVLFHLGYPYVDEVVFLTKTFANVSLDFCFNHVAQPTLACRALTEMLDFLPVNKIMAFGADYGFVEGAYAHQQITRENVAAALAYHADRGRITVDRASYIAARILRENAVEVYGLTDALVRASI